MNTLGNLLWLILGGILVAMMYYLCGLIMCITVIGIPFGVQLFKLGTFALWPFGHELVDGERSSGCLYVAMNLLWIVLGWWEIALMHLFFGCLFCLLFDRSAERNGFSLRRSYGLAGCLGSSVKVGHASDAGSGFLRRSGEYLIAVFLLAFSEQAAKAFPFLFRFHP